MSIANLLSRTLDGNSQVVTSWLTQALVSPLDGFVSQSGKRFRAKLVQSAWDLSLAPGSDRTLPSELPQVLELVHAGSLIVDDIEDGSASRRGNPTLHESHGVPLALNAGNALYFLPMVGLEAMGLSAEAELAIRRELALAMSRCHAGQALDLYATLERVPAHEVPELVESIAALKTGSLMASAAKLGAIAAGGSAKLVDALGAFGCELGICLQILDDLGNLGGQRDPGKHLEDLRTRRLTYAWAWLTLHQPPAMVAALRQSVIDGKEPLERTAALMLQLLGEAPRRAIRDRMHTASLKLSTALGARPGIDILLAEVHRLEASYG